MFRDILIIIASLAASWFVTWLFLNPKILQAQSKAVALNAAWEIAKEEITVLNGHLKASKDRIIVLETELASTQKRLTEAEEEKSRKAKQPMSLEEFRTRLLQFIDANIETLIKLNRGKVGEGGKLPHDEELFATATETPRVLGYNDALALTAKVRQVFVETAKVVPDQIEVVCVVAEAFLAPTTAERKRLLKSVAQKGEKVGVGFIIVAILSAIGLSHGVIGVIVTVLLAGPHVPAGLLLAGMTLTGIAGYFALTGNPEVDTERFRNALRAGLAEAVKKIWSEYGQELGRWHLKADS